MLRQTPAANSELDPATPVSLVYAEAPAPPADARRLPAPVPETPACGSRIARPAGKQFLMFGWKPVTGAASYTVEVDCLGCDGQGWSSARGTPWHVQRGLGLRSPIYSASLSRITGAALRWRVWAVDSAGAGGEMSRWCQMSFEPPAVAVASSITGTVTFDGKVPALRPLAMDSDPACAKKHSAPVSSEVLVLGNGNAMGNIMVWVSKGLPGGKTYPAPTTPVVLDQNGCQYKPHVMGIMVGQPYKILNSDGILHNIHTLPKVNPSFNQAMPATLKEVSTSFNKEEAIFNIRCDVHPWMSAYIGVFTHPFFSATSTDGRFTISGLDPGTYEITAWHERLGTRVASVTVGANETKTQNFEFTVPAK